MSFWAWVIVLPVIITGIVIVIEIVINVLAQIVVKLNK